MKKIKDKYESTIGEITGMQIGKVVQYGCLMGGFNQILGKENLENMFLWGGAYLVGYCVEKGIEEHLSEKRFNKLEKALKQK